MKNSTTLLAAVAATFALGTGAAFAEIDSAYGDRDANGHRIEQRVDPSVYSNPPAWADTDSGWYRTQREIGRIQSNGFLNRQYWGDGYVVRNWSDYGVGAPPSGYRWVRVNNELMLVSRNSGRIANTYALR